MAKREPPPGHDEVVSKGPCPNCDTEKGNVTYADGHAFCFACKHTTPSPRSKRSGDHQVNPRGDHGADDEASVGPDTAGSPHKGSADALIAGGTFKPLQSRGLRADTLRRYGYFTAGFKAQTVEVAPYYGQSGEPLAQKLRFPDKSFITLGDAKLTECKLFGWHVYGDRYDRRVVVTEGELDAMTVAQVAEFKYPAVSVSGGAGSAAKSLKANYLWIDRFDEIILWFDDDEPGRKALDECAPLFKVGKVRIAKVPGFKDASDVLQANKPGDIEAAIYTAVGWRPRGIVNAADSEADVLAPKPDESSGWSYNWPWQSVQDFLGPIKPGQVCYHVAGTGIGKTTGIAEIEYDLLKQGCKIAHMGFEDTRRDVKLRLLSIHTESRLDIEPHADAKMLKYHREVFGSKHVELFDPETAEWTVDAILGYVRYCARALDCRVIFIDPLTFIAAGLSLGDDERRALDKASRDLAAMAKELGVHLQVTHHLKRPEGTAHEEGAATSLNEVRGSGGIANFATFVLGHERNQQAEGDDSLLTQLRALKNRPRSRTGPMLVLKYDMKTGRLTPSAKPFPKAGKSKGGGGFSPIATSTSDDY